MLLPTVTNRLQSFEKTISVTQAPVCGVQNDRTVPLSRLKILKRNIQELESKVKAVIPKYSLSGYHKTVNYDFPREIFSGQVS
jgi:hypothetical protein